MKKLVSLVMILAMTLCLFWGCFGDPAQEASMSETEAKPTLSVIRKVALIADHGAFGNQSHILACWQGVQAWCGAYGVDHTYYETEEDSCDDRIASVRKAVDEGANVIFLPGFYFSTALLGVQELYPDVYFIAVDVAAGDLTYDYVDFFEPTSNAVCLSYAEEQIGYLAGYAAVKEGYTYPAFNGHYATPSIIRYGHGFVQGADAATTELGVNITVRYTYTGCFCDSYESDLYKMKSWENEGIDIVFTTEENLAKFVADQVEFPVIGVENDLAFCSANILTSALKEWQYTIETVLTDLQEGRWEEKYSGQCKTLSLEEGDFIGLPTAPESWRFENFTLEEYEAVKAEIRSGARQISDSIDAMPEVSDYTEIWEQG